MQKGDIVLVEFTGKELSTNKVFDTTNREIAEKNGILKEKGIYEPIPIIIGDGEIIKGLEEALLEMKEKEEKTVIVPPEKAFGERRAELVRVIPLKEFKQRNLQPFPGMIVNVNDVIGRVQSVSGGRVRVDFNNELAGKKLEYKIKIVKVLREKKEQINALFKKFFPFVEGHKLDEIKPGILEVIIPKKFAKQALPLKPLFARTVLTYVKGLNKVRFVEEFEKKEKEENEQKNNKN
jgi:FKBP-type peptidyl-prolyl cis-trans isomerase 2